MSSPKLVNTGIVEDLLQGINDWRQVPDIVRLALKSLSDVIRAQGYQLQELEDQVSYIKLNQGSDSGKSIQEIREELASKVSYHDLTSSIQYQTEGGSLFQSKFLDDFTKLQQQLNQKANIEEVTKALQEKASKQSVTNSLHKKANKEEIQALIASKAEIRDLQAVQQALEVKAEHVVLDELEDQVKQLKKLIATGVSLGGNTGGAKKFQEFLVDFNQWKSKIEREIQEKSFTKKIGYKENLSVLLQGKVDIEDFVQKFSDQALINQTLCSENCVARWIWKSGSPNNGVIPWDIQSVNTCPENFLWNNSEITTVAPGLYQVIFGFYSRRKPTVNILVNGEPAASLIPSRGQPRHSAGNLLGVTGVEFLALPARARLQFQITGESSGEGFFGLKKL